MKSLMAICVASATLMGMGARVQGAEPTTNINPALLYYQAFLAAPSSPAAPSYSNEDWDLLYASLSNGWRGQKLPERFGVMMSNYDAEFKLLRMASQQTAPCNWGIDWDDGPVTLLPELARAKQVAVTVRFRTAWNLQNGRQSNACAELLDTLALARSVSDQNAQIGVLVDIAMEAIVCESVAENFGRFTPESLQQLEDGLAAAPPRGTLAEASEGFHGEEYLASKVVEWRKAHPGGDAAVMAELQLYVITTYVEESNLWDKIVTASGGTSGGVLKLTDQVTLLRKRYARIMTLPYPAFQSEEAKFLADVENTGNPIAGGVFSPMGKSRMKEFRIAMQLDMVRAAIEYQLHGPAGFRSVRDPFGSGPFAFQRFVYRGVDRGFQLTSALTGLDYPAAQIFIENEGTPMHLDGPHVGESFE